MLSLRTFRLPSVQWQAWQTNILLALAGVYSILLCGQGVQEFHHYVIGFSLVAMYQSLIYLVAAWAVLNGPVNRWTFAIVLLCAAGCRLVCLFSPPHLSSDIFRYVWDGRVQAAGINPYRFIPADPHLAFLREGEVYPNINRRSYAHTIYPPGAQFLFLLITRMGQTVRWMKFGMIGLEALTIWILVKLLTALGLRREQVLLYAWHPLLFWEVGSSGHVDGAALPLIALALLFYVRHKPAATGLALAAATLVKLYPIVLFPALYRRSELRVNGWKMPVAMVALIAGAYACYLSVGARVLGFLPDYAKEEGLESGTRYFFLTQARNTLHWQAMPTGAFYGFAALLLLGLAILAWLNPEFVLRVTHARKPLRDSPGIGYGFAIATALMLLFSSHYPWYYLWLLPFVCLIPYVPMLYFITACFFLYTTSLANPGPAMFYMFQWLYASTALLALWCLGNAFVRNYQSVRES